MRIDAVEPIPAAPERFEALVPVTALDASAEDALRSDAQSVLQLDDIAQAAVASEAWMAPWQVDALEARAGDDALLHLDRPAGSTGALLSYGLLATAGLSLGTAILAPLRFFSQPRDTQRFIEATLEFVPEPETRLERDVWFPLVRMHCPRREECTASYSLEQADGQEGRFELAIAGIGGGAGVKVTARDSETYETEGPCIEIAMPGRIAMVIPRVLDGCEQPFDVASALPDWWTIDRLGAASGAGAVTKELSLERELSGKVGVDLEMAGAPVKLALSFERTTTATTTVTTELSPGSRYGTYAPEADGAMERCWTTA